MKVSFLGKDIYPTAMDIFERTGKGEAVETDGNTDKIFDNNFLTGISLHNNANSDGEHRVNHGFLKHSELHCHISPLYSSIT